MTRTIFAALSLLALPASAADPSQPFVSVENATYHQLVFANEDVAILNNLYPPHSDSGFHLHSRPLFYVTVAAARASTQKPGQPLVTPQQMAPTGSVGFNVMTSEPFVHRVVNTDDKAYHVIAVEIRRPVPSGNPITHRSAAQGYSQIFDNDSLRAWRVTLGPGEATQPITPVADGIRVVVRGGFLTTAQPGLPDQILALEKGNFAFQAAGMARTLRNTGKTTIELVELELK